MNAGPPNAHRAAAIVLAAGTSSRFGRPKLLASLWGRPLLQHVLDVVAAVELSEVVVVLGHDAEEIERGVRWRSERRVRNPDPEAGLSGSLRIGLENVDQSSEAALILLGDQPLVRADVLERLLAGFASEARPITVPRYRGGGGPNPLLLHRTAWPLARDAKADRGLGPIVRDHPDLVTVVDVSGSNPDVDTPEDLAALEAGAQSMATATDDGATVGVGPAQRIWLQDRGTPVFGAGIRELLVRVESTGSLRRAASEMGMAYSKAWHIVRRAEEHLGFALLERRTGGKGGGGSGVSAEGRWMVGAFGAMRDEADLLLDDLYAKHFGDWPHGKTKLGIDDPEGRAPRLTTPPRLAIGRADREIGTKGP
jgi:molybdenum cofactor cytidylyltransferase